MKAKTMENPTSRLWVLLILLVAIIFAATKINAVDMVTYNEDNVDKSLEENTKIFKSVEKTNAEKVDIIHQGALAIQSNKEAEAKAIAEEESRYSDYGVCALNAYTKTYMDYRAISTNSSQASIIYNNTFVNDEGFLETEDGFIGVALGSYYGPLGSKYRVTTDTGQVFKVIKVEAKANQHTTNNCQDFSGAIIEFVIDTQAVRNAHPYAVHSGNFNNIDYFSGNIVKIESYN